jgi:hypothetical protein
MDVDPPATEKGAVMRLLPFLLLTLSAGVQQRIFSLSAPATGTLCAIGAGQQLMIHREAGRAASAWRRPERSPGNGAVCFPEPPFTLQIYPFTGMTSQSTTEPHILLLKQFSEVYE